MIKGLLVAIVMMCLTVGAWAQYTITGTIYDENKEPLAGATISVKEAPERGTITDENGKYKLVIPNNKDVSLHVSFIGYAAQTVKVSGCKNAAKDFYMLEDQEILDEIVVTGTRTPRLLKEVPILTRVIKNDDIKMHNVTHIGELLQVELPGIEFSYSMNQQVSLNMQGFGGNSVLFLVDGERVAGETLDNIDYNRLNLDNVERIEIVKGGVSSLYGSNAVGGVVNLISKDESRPWSVNVNTLFGAHGEQRYGTSLGVKKGKISNTVNAQYHKVGAIEFDNAGDYDKIYANKNWNVKDRLVYKPLDNLKFTANAGFFFRERDSQTTVKERYRSLNGGLKGNYSFTNHDDFEVAYTFDEYDKSDYGIVSKLDVRDYSNVQHTGRALYNHTFLGRNILTVGGGFMRDYLMTYQFTNNGHHEQYTADGFAQFDWSINRDLNVIGGLRYDYFSDADIHHISPQVAVRYKWNRCSLRGSYASGFRAPTLKEMYMSFNMANIFMIYGNPDLKPESSHNFSVSAEYLNGNYNLTVNGFYNLVDNRITTAWNKAKMGMVYTNMAKLNICGVDINASANFPCGISAKVSYAFTHEHIKKGEPLTSSTRPHTATARIEYGKHWKNYGLKAALNGRFLSQVTTDVYTSSTSYEETVKETYPAYTVWNLNLIHDIWKGINVTMGIDNLFNYVPKYYYSNSPSTTGITFWAGLSLDVDKFFK